MFEGAIIGFLLGKIRGGRLSNIKFLHMKWWPLLIFALGLQILGLLFQDFTWISYYGGFLDILSLLCMSLVIFLNRDRKGSSALFVGVVLNLLVIVINKGRMPISIDSLEFAGNELLIEEIKKGEMVRYIASGEAVSFSQALGKYITVPKPYPFAKVLSIGDLFMTLGVILFIQGEMLKSRFGQTPANMIKIPYKGKE
ncbi:DUF5317 domain-containing protein [Inediibacterium massiliense]|uniref:DUF5317 domain-containing protein n=1 Tax=Inediibacterium massiliense TaxID=1658111 RepID=UPI0006B5ACF7|nr:DUF5317 domain-containing protein [Inediibacterium massiliense]